MIISSIMRKNPIFIRPDTSLTDAKALMVKENIGKLPVLDKDDRLVGLVTKKDLEHAEPSEATTLDMYEISYLLSKLKVEKIMIKNVITVQENEVIEEAARIMADNDIGCLPVMRDSLMVGIITESDLFEAFVDMFGARYKGVRVTLTLPEKPGQLAIFTKALADKGGNIVSLVTSEGDNLSKRRCTCKISGIEMDAAKTAADETGGVIEDIRII